MLIDVDLSDLEIYPNNQQEKQPGIAKCAIAFAKFLE